MAYTINQAKEAPGSRCPLHLFEFTLTDGTVLRVAKHAVTYGGHAYQPRVLQQQLGATEALSPTGIEIPPNVKVTLADADREIYQLHRSPGFRGARLVVRFVFYDFSTGEFSSNSAIPFVGKCGRAGVTDTTVTITAGFILNLQAKMAPFFPIQQACPKLKPRTIAQRALRDDPDSIWYACGSDTEYDCGHTPEGCVVNNDPLRFGGFPTATPPASRSREYVTGNWLDDLTSDPCAAKYGDYAPIGFGTGWVDCLVTECWPEANSTRGHAIVCEGVVKTIHKVIVADEELPAATDIEGAVGYSVRDPLFRYNVLNRGYRAGRKDQDRPWNGNADPAGSLCYIEWCINRKAATSTPRVRALVTFEDVTWYERIDNITNGVVTFADNAPNTNCAGNPPYSVTIEGNSNAALNDTPFSLSNWTWGPPGTVTLSGTSASGTGGYLRFQGPSSNPAWAILRLLQRAGLDIADVSKDWFIRVSHRNKEQVSYVDQDGNTLSHDRFECSLVIRQRRAVSEIITGLLRGCRCHLGRDQATGQAALFPHDSLAMQQPAAEDGSNDDTPVNGGYLAYHFDESAIVREENGASTLECPERGIGGIPNSVTISFANAARDYCADSIRMIDGDDINDVGQEISASGQFEGICSLDQAKRIGSTFLAEQLAGDPFSWRSTFKGVRLMVGKLVALTCAKWGFDKRLVRIQKIEPDPDYEGARYTGSLHQDSWFADTYGQAADPPRGDALSRPQRPPYPWQASYTGGTFGVRELQEKSADGSLSVKVAVEGVPPINSFAAATRPPVLSSVDVATSGGNIVGGRTYVVAVAGVDDDGLTTDLSNIVTVHVPAGSHNKLTLNLHWFTGAHHAAIYVGRDVNHWHYEGATVGTEDSFDIVYALAEVYQGPPDYAMNHFVLRAKAETPGIWVAPAIAVGAHTIQFSGVTWAVNQWVGREVEVLSTDTDHPFGVPPVRITVVSNTADTLTVSSDYDLDSYYGFGAGDYFVMRTSPGTVTALSAQDTAWSLEAGAHVGRLARILSGTGEGQAPRPIVANTSDTITVNPPWDTQPDSTSRIVIEDADWMPEVQTQSYSISNWGGVSSQLGAISVPNQAGLVVLVQVLTASADGKRCADSVAPLREIRIQGAQGTREISASTTMRQGDGLVKADTSGGNVIYDLLSISQAGEQTLTVNKATGDGNTVTVQAALGNTFPNGSSSLTLTDSDLNGTAHIRFPKAGTKLVLLNTPGSAIGAGNMLYRGDWVSGTSYAVNDTVTFGANLYLRLFAGGGTTDPSIDVANWKQLSGGTATAGVFVVQRITLNANATIPSPQTPVDGQGLMVILTQANGGGHTITWAAEFEDAPTDIGMGDGKKTILQFVGLDGAWQYLPIAGV